MNDEIDPAMSEELDEEPPEGPVPEEVPAPPAAWELDPVPPEWREAADDPLAVALLEDFGEAIESARSFAGELTLQVRRDDIAEVCASLKEKHGFVSLIDLCGADPGGGEQGGREPRFDVVYQLRGLAARRRLRLRVRTDEATPVPTVRRVWRAADWFEREVWDLYGVRFADHPDLTRLLLWEGFAGHPLRKEFPVEGIDTGSAREEPA